MCSNQNAEPSGGYVYISTCSSCLLAQFKVQDIRVDLGRFKTTNGFTGCSAGEANTALRSLLAHKSRSLDTSSAEGLAAVMDLSHGQPINPNK